MYKFSPHDVFAEGLGLVFRGTICINLKILLMLQRIKFFIVVSCVILCYGTYLDAMFLKLRIKLQYSVMFSNLYRSVQDCGW